MACLQGRITPEKTVEGLEYQNLLGNLGNGLSVKGLHSTVYATLQSPGVSDRRRTVELHSRLAVIS